MSIEQLQNIVAGLKKEAKENPDQDAEFHVAYKILQDKIRERDKYKIKINPANFEHELDIKEEFQLE